MLHMKSVVATVTVLVDVVLQVTMLVAGTKTASIVIQISSKDTC